jgi:hypothetical protein
MRKYQVRFGERSRETRSLRDEKVRSAPTRPSPVLSNILLDKLDRFVETVLIPQYTRGKKRKLNQEYVKLHKQMHKLLRKGQKEAALKLRKQLQRLSSIDPHEPDYRRLKYVRYADDVRHLTRC